MMPGAAESASWRIMARAQRTVTTVLFTDIVGSTERAAELGDRGWAELLEEHHAGVRREIKRFVAVR